MFSFITRTTVIGFAAGLLAGALGARYYRQHETEINARLRSLRTGGILGGASQESSKEDADLTLEALESQKARLEDLIADLQSKKK
ncbi:MAG: hypothetical protein ACI4NA_02515 [Succinivibrio sp.]